ncbi:MAG: hypothetical protein LCH61_01860 [Proteobacteria bacterium]|nr:hypothetical protein [Pseudomonadota bacterium]
MRGDSRGGDGRRLGEKAALRGPVPESLGLLKRKGALFRSKHISRNRGNLGFKRCGLGFEGVSLRQKLVARLVLPAIEVFPRDRHRFRH